MAHSQGIQSIRIPTGVSQKKGGTCKSQPNGSRTRSPNPGGDNVGLFAAGLSPSLSGERGGKRADGNHRARGRRLIASLTPLPLHGNLPPSIQTNIICTTRERHDEENKRHSALAVYNVCHRALPVRRRFDIAAVRARYAIVARCEIRIVHPLWFVRTPGERRVGHVRRANGHRRVFTPAREVYV